MLRKILSMFEGLRRAHCKGTGNYGDHDVDDWLETSGRGRTGVCKRCGDTVYRPEMS